MGYDIAMKDSISLRSANVTQIWCLATISMWRGAEGLEKYARVRGYIYKVEGGSHVRNIRARGEEDIDDGIQESREARCEEDTGSTAVKERSIAGKGTEMAWRARARRSKA